MDSLIQAYGIDFEAFRWALKEHNGLVAGSFALAGFLKQEGLEPGFEPNDMDIFLHGAPIIMYNDDGSLTEPVRARIPELESFAAFLKQYEFSPTTSHATTEAEYYRALKSIYRVVSFRNAGGKIIQVIMVRPHNVVAHIANEFDLTCCACWWNPSVNTFVSRWSASTKRRKMFYTRQPRDERDAAKLAARAKKYEERGFTLDRMPCAVHTKADGREELSASKFDGLTAHDILTMEDVPVRDFLGKSRWNIVLKAGDQLYAFDREPLMKLMAKSQTKVNWDVGIVYQTPFNQSITTTAYWNLRFADYSIYELKPAYPITAGTKIVSMYTVYAYTIKEWVDGTEGKKMGPPAPPISPPSIAELRQMLRAIARLFKGHAAPDIIAQNPVLIPEGCREAFKEIVRELEG
jgi:hypothetical protein